MADLNGASVFLSAGFPAGERGEPYRPYDIDAVADAVTSVVEALLAANGRLVFGGHPTITPLVLRIAARSGRQGVITVYQSLWFENDFTEATKELVGQGYATIIRTAKNATRAPSLEHMRDRMLLEPTHLVGGVFIGGMEGIELEFAGFGNRRPEVPRIPLAGPGGAAARIATSSEPTFVSDPVLRDIVFSTRYPLAASRLVDFLGARA